MEVFRVNLGNVIPICQWVICGKPYVNPLIAYENSWNNVNNNDIIIRAVSIFYMKLCFTVFIIAQSDILSCSAF